MSRALTATPLIGTFEEPVPGGICRVGVAVRPDEVTVVAQLRLEPGNTFEPDSVERQVASFQRWGQEFLQRVAERIRPAIEAPLREENHRLRSALTRCAEVCGTLLDRTHETGSEGMEREQAEAWLALEAARQALEERPGETRLLE